jgi:cyclopropane-fatty-acyl-phospholipid synthase
MIERFARDSFFRLLAGFRGGRVHLTEGGVTRTFGEGEREATLVVERPSFYRRALFGGDVGLGESYTDGDWSSPDLVALVRLAILNVQRMDSGGWFWSLARRFLDLRTHRARANTLEGSRRNIGEHYDLGNAFYALFLDPSMTYSCALWKDGEDTLEDAQARKYDLIARKAELEPECSVMEIGCGWGGFAAHAAHVHGARVTATTISREQHDHAQGVFAALGEAGRRVQLMLADYRKLSGRFDRLVSIEMFEAVGLDHYDEYFAACDALLAPGGTMVMQTITMNERSFPSYHGGCDWIQKHVFPGGELASVTEIMRSLARASSMGLVHLEDIGLHYARTLACWRERFNARLPEVRALGFPERFVRLWDYYLAYCEAAFHERHIGVAQLVLKRAGAA